VLFKYLMVFLVWCSHFAMFISAYVKRSIFRDSQHKIAVWLICWISFNLILLSLFQLVGYCVANLTKGSLHIRPRVSESAEVDDTRYAY
jgi:uncharacterized membrane protein YpjA